MVSTVFVFYSARNFTGIFPFIFGVYLFVGLFRCVENGQANFRTNNLMGTKVRMAEGNCITKKYESS